MRSLEIHLQHHHKPNWPLADDWFEIKNLSGLRKRFVAVVLATLPGLIQEQVLNWQAGLNDIHT